MEKTTQVISLVLVLVCLGLYIAFPHPAAFGLAHDRVWSRLTYLWFHGNIIHYLINIYALCTLTFRCGINSRTFFTGLMVAIFIPECVITDMPIVGLSGWLFFLMGSLTIRILPENRFRFVATNTFIILITSLMTHIAWGLHLWCFALGITYSFIESHKGTDKRFA